MKQRSKLQFRLSLSLSHSHLLSFLGFSKIHDKMLMGDGNKQNVRKVHIFVYCTRFVDGIFVMEMVMVDSKTYCS